MRPERINAVYRELGQRIQRRRKELKLTQEELGSRVGLSRTSITNIEKGRQHVLLHVLLDFGKALELPPEMLISKTVTDMEQSVGRKLPPDLDPGVSLWVKQIMAG